MRRHLWLAGLAVVIAVGGSCSSSPESSSDASYTEASAPTADSGLAGTESDALVAPLLNGGTFDLKSALASAPVAMWFWAPG